MEIPKFRYQHLVTGLKWAVPIGGIISLPFLICNIGNSLDNPPEGKKAQALTITTSCSNSAPLLLLTTNQRIDVQSDVWLIVSDGSQKVTATILKEDSSEGPISLPQGYRQIFGGTQEDSSALQSPGPYHLAFHDVPIFQFPAYQSLRTNRSNEIAYGETALPNCS